MGEIPQLQGQNHVPYPRKEGRGWFMISERTPCSHGPWPCVFPLSRGSPLYNAFAIHKKGSVQVSSNFAGPRCQHATKGQKRPSCPTRDARIARTEPKSEWGPGRAAPKPMAEPGARDLFSNLSESLTSDGPPAATAFDSSSLVHDVSMREEHCLRGAQSNPGGPDSFCTLRGWLSALLLGRSASLPTVRERGEVPTECMRAKKRSNK